MAIVRELTTVLDFKLDPAGLSQTEQAVNNIKTSIIALGKLFGIVFAAEKVKEWVDELFTVGKEINKLTYQLNRMAREGDNIPAAMESLFGIAQDTGVEYTKVLDVYKEMLNESHELNVSQDQLLLTVGNIYKGLRVGAASSEEISQTFESLNRSFRMGRIGRRQFGLLTDIAPGVVDALASSLGKTREQLEEMAKEGKLTANVLINGLGKSIKALNDEFANRPRKLGEAFTYAWNKVGVLAARIWKLVNVTGTVANAIVRLVDVISDRLQRLSNAVGGLKRGFELLAIAVAVVFGRAFIRNLSLAAVWTARLAARTWLLVAAYSAWALAVVGIVLAIQDLMVWIQGSGGSVIGDLVGPFDQFMEQFKKAFDTANFFAPFKAFQNFVDGDFAGSWEKIKQSIKDVDGLLGVLGVSIIAVALAWRGWNLLKFTGLIEAIGAVALAIKGISVAAAVAFTDLVKIAKARVLLAGGAVGAAALVALYGKEVLQSGLDAALGRDPDKAAADRSAAQGAGSSQFWGALKALNPFSWFPSVTPGQMTPPLPGSLETGAANNNTVNQTNNVTIKVEPSQEGLTAELKAAAESIMDSWGRQARNAVPVTESPKQ